MNTFKKVKWFLGILGVFLLVLLTNLVDKQNFERVESAVDNIYNKRLLAKGHLLELIIKFHEKELAYAFKDSIYLQSQNDRVNSEITELLQMFERTGATNKEKIFLEELNETHAKLIAFESNSQLNDTLYSAVCIKFFVDIDENINGLAAEQVKEANRENHFARDAVRSVKLFTQIEIYLLIFLAIILQIIVLYSPKKETSES